MKTYVYIDGFNFYYGVIKNSPYKWLDLWKFCQLILPKNQIEYIRYFTALVTSTPSNPDQQLRQRTYLRALQTIPNLAIHRGHFLRHNVMMPLANPSPGSPNCVEVVKTEEKGSDVNLATHLLWDGFQNLYDIAVVISNDSDLVEPIRIVRQELKKTVGIINPHLDRPSVQLKNNCDFYRTIHANILQKSQFPTSIIDAKGKFEKPVTW